VTFRVYTLRFRSQTVIFPILTGSIRFLLIIIKQFFLYVMYPADLHVGLKCKVNKEIKVKRIFKCNSRICTKCGKNYTNPGRRV